MPSGLLCSASVGQAPAGRSFYADRVAVLGVRSEEIVLPFPGGALGQVPPATEFRSTWLSSSLRSLRHRGLSDAYFAALPRDYRAIVQGTVVGTWLSIDVAMAHYLACDALPLSQLEMVQIGREAAGHVHGSTVSTVSRLARGAGVTPWSVLTRLDELWARVWRGGGVCVRKRGPKEARIEVAGWPCVNSTYCRAGLRGVVLGLTEHLCERAYGKELEPAGTRTSVAYLLSWA